MKNNSFLTRTISGVVLVAILLVAGLIGHEILLLFCLIVSTVGMKELYTATGVYVRTPEDKKNNMLAYAGLIMGSIYFVASYALAPLATLLVPGDSLFSQTIFEAINTIDTIQILCAFGYMTAIVIYAVSVFIVMGLIYVFSFPRFDFKQIAYAIFGALYTPLFVTAIMLIRGLNNGKFVFWLIFISSWMCDTCAYLVGCSIGKHKLAPILSPKKSIEGAVGGVAGSVIVAFVLGFCVEYKIFGGNNNAVAYMIICFFGAIVSQIGDLFASAIKRNNDIKDYGTLIPGHGGILDRFDSVIFVAPVIYLLAVLFL